MSFVEWPLRSTIMGAFLFVSLAWVMLQTMAPIEEAIVDVCTSCGVVWTLREAVLNGSLVILVLIIIGKTIVIVDFEGGARA